MQITWLSYFGSENQGLPLRSWFMTCWLWRHMPIVTSLAVPSSCVVTQTPMGTNSGTKHRKRKFPLLFVNCDRGRIEIDHLYGLRCRGWYYNPEQHSLCRPARPQAAGTTRAVPDCSTNHSSADRIVVNSYNDRMNQSNLTSALVIFHYLVVVLVIRQAKSKQAKSKLIFKSEIHMALLFFPLWY